MPENRPEGSGPAPQNEETNLFRDADLIFAYTRAQAIDDGVLVDVSARATEAGFRVPVAVTAALWADITTIPPEWDHEDVEGRLWDVLWMGYMAARQSKGEGSELIYPLILHTLETSGEELYPVKMHIGPGDDGEPVITLLKPDED